MKKKVVALIFSFGVFVASVSAQVKYSPEKNYPAETTFTQDSILFYELLSEFSMRCQQYDTLLVSEWYNPLNRPDVAALDAKYERIILSTPVFVSFPAFRVDCPNGFVLGILNHYNNHQSIVSYLDVLSYNLKGKMISKISFAWHNIATYLMDDERSLQKFQLGGIVNIVNGEINYSVDQRCWIDEISSYSKSFYRYKIQDDATLKLLSVDHKQDK